MFHLNASQKTSPNHFAENTTSCRVGLCEHRESSCTICKREPSAATCLLCVESHYACYQCLTHCFNPTILVAEETIEDEAISCPICKSEIISTAEINIPFVTYQRYSKIVKQLNQQINIAEKEFQNPEIRRTKLEEQFTTIPGLKASYMIENPKFIPNNLSRLAHDARTLSSYALQGQDDDSLRQLSYLAQLALTLLKRQTIIDRICNPKIGFLFCTPKIPIDFQPFSLLVNETAASLSNPDKDLILLKCTTDIIIMIAKLLNEWQPEPEKIEEQPFVQIRNDLFVILREVLKNPQEPWYFLPISPHPAIQDLSSFVSSYQFVDIQQHFH